MPRREKMNITRFVVLVLILAVPARVFAECDAKIAVNDLTGDVQKKLDCFAAENADLKRQLQSLKAAAPKARPRFADGQWRYLAMPKMDGNEVARRLTAIGPPQDSVVVVYDGSSHNTFHIWYRGQGTNTRYTYTGGTNSDLADPPSRNFFLSESGVIPAGIGGIGNTPVPIYFIATQ